MRMKKCQCVLRSCLYKEKKLYNFDFDRYKQSNKYENASTKIAQLKQYCRLFSMTVSVNVFCCRSVFFLSFSFYLFSL